MEAVFTIENAIKDLLWYQVEATKPNTVPTNVEDGYFENKVEQTKQLIILAVGKQTARIAELEEYEKLFKANAKDFLLHKLEISGEGCEAVLEHPVVFVFASAIADYFIATNAENYVEIALNSSIGRLIVNIQKEEGKSPHEIRRELEAQVERLRWLFPADSELPPNECDVLFVVDTTVENGHYADSKFWDGDGLGICPERVTRWRYID